MSKTICRLTVMRYEDEAGLVRTLEATIRSWNGDIGAIAKALDSSEATVRRYVAIYELQCELDEARGDVGGVRHARRVRAGSRGGRCRRRWHRAGAETRPC